MAQRAGGLYGGIHFSTATALPNEQPQPSPVAPTPTAPPEVVIEARPVLATPVPGAAASVPVSAQAAPASSEVPKSSTAQWSAALAFAPVRRAPNKPKQTTSRLPPGVIVASLQAAALPTTAQTVQSQAQPLTEQEPASGWAKKVQAPSMVIDGDVNGFRAVKPGEGKRRKKNKNINANQLVWDPMEPYDPFHPNDYHEYKAWKKRSREEKRREEIRRIEDLKRRRDSSHSEYTSESDSDDGRRGRKTARYHSPERDDDAPRGLGMRRPEPEDSSMQGSSPVMAPQAPSLPQPETGEEAYLRRLAMSQRPPPSANPPMFTPQANPVAQQMAPSFTPPTQDSVPPPPPRFTPAVPLFQQEDAGFESNPPFQPPENTMQAPPVSLTQAEIDERRKNAAAIAARLAALSKPPPAPAAPPPTEGAADGEPVRRDPAKFAERMMAKYGHVAGQGLGARGDGIVEPIMLERAAPASSTSTGKAGKKKGDANAIGEDGKPKKPMAGGMGVGGARMGRIVNAQAEEKNRADLLKFGESSRIVLLRNMVAPEDVDDDLQGEIGEECSKHGTVERVFVHMPYIPPVDPLDTVRIFVQFSGPAGAWKAVRDLDGRFFGGKTVRARYFDEGNFARGLYDVPV